jgi:choline dehydrogenase-like flavoprotein
VQTAVYQLIGRDVFMVDYRNEIQQAEDVTVYLRANVLELETTSSGERVNHAHVGCLNGNAFRVQARLFVLAVGGIETPRLLLLSNKTHQAGLGNQHDLVGRFFMEHPHLWSGTFVPQDTDIFRTAGLYGVHQAKGGQSIIGQLTLSQEVLRREKMLGYSVVLVPSVRSTNLRKTVSQGASTFRLLASAIRQRDLSDFNRHLSTLFPVVNDFSIAMYRQAARLFNKLRLKKFEVFRLNHMVEQVPNPNSRVSLSEERDAFGQNRVRLNWQMSAIDIRSIRRAQEIIDEELRRAGLGHLQIELHDDTPPPDLHGGWHHMGTTRMHRDPKQGVVDEHAKVHNLSNLYIAGPSVFPTGGYSNPVLTIVALTLRLADHIKQCLAPETAERQSAPRSREHSVLNT